MMENRTLDGLTEAARFELCGCQACAGQGLEQITAIVFFVASI
jgi:hypothetical protein